MVSLLVRRPFDGAAKLETHDVATDSRGLMPQAGTSKVPWE